MRSFLIRDILSGPSSVSTAAGKSQEGSATGDSQPIPNSSSFGCMAAQSLAATQARFLAKLAEHQQQVQASNYYELLQQQNHQQLLNLNLNHHNLQLHQQQQQLLHQLGSGGGNHKNQNFTSNNNVSGSSSGSGSCRNATSRHGISSSSATSSSTSYNKAKQKASSFAYDCASPISSISDADQVEDDDGEGCRGGIRRNDIDEEDDEDEDVEIEVERLSGEESEHAGSRHSSRRQRSHLGANEDSANQAGEEDYNDNNEDGDDEDLDDDEDRDHEGVSESNRLSSQQQQQFKRQQQLIGKQLPAPFQLNSPLDALFQMTSSTFDALKRGERRKDREADHHGSTNFTSKQTSKKKRKSRTAFTNNQIYELERRFREQKYLSPTDRDEIAMALNLSNAQVITWFQNRRAKLKRDLEEQKRDIETASLMNIQKRLYESFQALSQMQTAIKTEGICRTGGTNIQEERDMNQLS